MISHAACRNHTCTGCDNGVVCSAHSRAVVCSNHQDHLNELCAVVLSSNMRPSPGIWLLDVLKHNCFSVTRRNTEYMSKQLYKISPKSESHVLQYCCKWKTPQTQAPNADWPVKLTLQALQQENWKEEGLCVVANAPLVIVDSFHSLQLKINLTVCTILSIV